MSIQEDIINVDYLVQDWVTDFVDREEEIPEDIAKELESTYLDKKEKINYIYYTGIGCNRNYKHSVDEIIKIGSEFGIDGSWPIIVVLIGAGVVWKIC